jgi:hypothetical protein
MEISDQISGQVIHETMRNRVMMNIKLIRRRIDHDYHDYHDYPQREKPQMNKTIDYRFRDFSVHNLLVKAEYVFVFL